MTEKRKKGCLFGLAIGDAMGAPVEFMRRGSFVEVKNYCRGGKFRLEACEWTDDTAMALCLAQSLIDSQGFDPHDQMEKYLKWMDCGYMSCRGKAIGMGKIVMRSLIRYRRNRQAYTDIKHEKFSGNGSLMRLAPVCAFYADDLDSGVRYASLSSATTHGSAIARDACRYFSYLIIKLFQGAKKEEIFTYQFKKDLERYFEGDPLHKSLDVVIRGCYKNKSEKGIVSSGYVVNSLKAALWSFYHTDTFEKAILTAVNLGDDADTVGAITGQLAGACYGMDGIPKQWIDRLGNLELVDGVFGRLASRVFSVE